MSRFVTYINERKYSLDDMIYLIKKDCQPFLKDWKKLNTNDFLYTGRKNEKTFVKKSIRTNRTPKDTPLTIHNWLDEWFYKKFGIKSRSNAIFTSFFKPFILKYGIAYMAFPIGNYVSISSNKIKDLYIELDNRFYLNNFNENKIVYSNKDEEKLEMEKEFKKTLYNFLEKSNYKKGLRHNASEIMINCKEYYIINCLYETDILKSINNKE